MPQAERASSSPAPQPAPISFSPPLQAASGPLGFKMTNDYFFKALFQKNESALKSFVCALLHLDPESLGGLDIMNPIVLGEKVDDKEVVLDIRLMLSNDSVLDLEMQVVRQTFWVARSLYYLVRNQESLKRGERYGLLMPSVQIDILDFQPFEERPIFYDTNLLMSIHDYHVYTDLLSIGYVDLTNIALATDEDRLYNIDKWAKLFKCTTWEELKMLATQDAAIKDAVETVYVISEDEKIRQRMEAREDYYRIERDWEWALEKERLKNAAQKKALEERDKELVAQQKALEERDKENAAQKKALEERDRENAAQKKALEERDKELAEQNNELAAQKKALEERDQELAAQKQLIEELRQQLNAQRP